jgi:maleate isomerase
MAISARIGLLAPPGNVALETEFPRYLPDDIALHTTRVFRSNTDVTYDGLREMLDNVQSAATLIARVKPAVVMYGCTSGSLLGGAAANRTLTASIEACTNTRVITTATAIVDALRAKQAKSLFLVTPYVAELNEAEERFLAEEGFRVISTHSLEGRTSEQIRSIPSGAVVDLVAAHRNEARKADAVLISCTNLHVMDVVDDLERQVGIPVVTSNQASLWAALGVLGKTLRNGRRAGSLFH